MTEMILIEGDDELKAIAKKEGWRHNGSQVFIQNLTVKMSGRWLMIVGTTIDIFIINCNIRADAGCILFERIHQGHVSISDSVLRSNEYPITFDHCSIDWIVDHCMFHHANDRESISIVSSHHQITNNKFEGFVIEREEDDDYEGG